jgi:hypothetical protein
MTAMRTFIETYLADPSKAVDEARQRLDTEAWIDDFDEDRIYEEIASPEFHLYEEMIMCGMEGVAPHARDFAVVA